MPSRVGEQQIHRTRGTEHEDMLKGVRVYKLSGVVQCRKYTGVIHVDLSTGRIVHTEPGFVTLCGKSYPYVIWQIMQRVEGLAVEDVTDL